MGWGARRAGRELVGAQPALGGPGGADRGGHGAGEGRRVPRLDRARNSWPDAGAAGAGSGSLGRQGTGGGAFAWTPPRGTRLTSRGDPRDRAPGTRVFGLLAPGTVTPS